jgi:hypothetical protein
MFSDKPKSSRAKINSILILPELDKVIAGFTVIRECDTMELTLIIVFRGIGTELLRHLGPEVIPVLQERRLPISRKIAKIKNVRLKKSGSRSTKVRNSIENLFPVRAVFTGTVERKFTLVKKSTKLLVGSSGEFGGSLRLQRRFGGFLTGSG